MKKILLVLFAMLFSFTACTDEFDWGLSSSGDNSAVSITYSMVLDGDVDRYGGATRSGGGGNEWQDGDRLYIHFKGDDSAVFGCAVFSASNGEWTLTCNSAFTAGEEKKCDVYYFENAAHKSNAAVELTAHSVVYECIGGSYSYDGTGLVLSARLSPKNGRIYFVSSREQSFTISGISCYTTFDLEKNEFVTSSAPLELEVVQRDGKCTTNYVYGCYTNEKSRKFSLRVMGVGTYMRAFPISMLQPGSSGYITMPTEDSCDGWDFLPKTGEFSGTLNGYEWVDLGLPSGIKWATCNVGATTPEAYGGYYAWGETEEKNDYSWSTYKWCNGSSTTMTKYCTNSSWGTVDNKTTLDLEDDVAHVEWGGSWRMPTESEQIELLENCTWTWTTQNGVNGYKVMSNTNGNSIFLRPAGYRDGAEVYERGHFGYGWSSSPGSHYYACSLYSGDSESSHAPRYYGCTVRPVCGGRYTVTVSSEGGGSVAISGCSAKSTTFEADSVVTVVATPDEGYVFECWCEPETGEIFSEDAEYAFTVSEDVALTARFDVDLSAYYYIRNGYFTDKYAALNSSTKKIEPKAKGTTDNYLWSFVKNVDGTIRIYNKANGEAAYVENAADDQAVLVGKEYDWTLVETTNDLGNKGIGIVSANGSSAWYTNPTSWSYILTKPYTWGGSVWTLEKSNVRVETSIE